MSATCADFKTIKIQKLSDQAIAPTRAHESDAGLDLYCLEEVRLEPGCGKIVSTGIAVEIWEGFVGLIQDRSSMAKRGIKTAGGVIDAGYRGELKVSLWNIGREPFVSQPGDRIAQLLILPIATPQPEIVENLEVSTRDSGGFGSTGR